MAGPYYTTIQGETAGESTSAESNPELGNRVVRGLHTKGDLVVIERLYTLLGTEAATEEIYICRNYPEMRLIPHLSAVYAENPGTALVIDIGDDAADVTTDTDQYSNELTLSAGGVFLFTAGSQVATRDDTPVITDDQSAQGAWIKALIKTATSLTAGQKIRFVMVFAVNS